MGGRHCRVGQLSKARRKLMRRAFLTDEMPDDGPSMAARQGRIMSLALGEGSGRIVIVGKVDVLVLFVLVEVEGE